VKVPRYDPVAADAPIRDEIKAAVAALIDTGRFIGGAAVEELERELSRRSGARVVTCASGTDALALALRVRNDGNMPVAVPALTFSATASAVYRAGFEPVLVDVREDTMTIDWSQVPPTFVAVPVHLFGFIDSDIPDRRPVVEDACQAWGAIQNPELAAVSFFPSKPLGAYGDAGAIVCHARYEKRLRALRAHGALRRYYSSEPGFNSRLDALQAAILRVKLRNADAAREERARIANMYTQAITAMDRDWLRPPPGHPHHTWHIYALRCDATRRDAFMDHMRSYGVDVAVQYPALHHQPAFSNCARLSDLGVATRCASELVSIPVWAGMTESQVHCVLRAIEAF